MPTNRRHYMITDTDEVSEALADAAARCPVCPHRAAAPARRRGARRPAHFCGGRAGSRATNQWSTDRHLSTRRPGGVAPGVARMIVLDARILIAHLANNDAHHERATRLLVSLAGQPKTMSVLTRAEVLVSPARPGRGAGAPPKTFSISCASAPVSCRATLPGSWPHCGHIPACGCRTATYCSPPRSTAQPNWRPLMSGSPVRPPSGVSLSGQVVEVHTDRGD